MDFKQHRTWALPLEFTATTAEMERIATEREQISAQLRALDYRMTQLRELRGKQLEELKVLSQDKQ